MEILDNYSITKLNTFGLDVTAKKYVSISTAEDAIDFFEKRTQQDDRALILGGGSNLLFSNNFFDGLVIHNNIPGIHIVKEDEHYFWVKAGAGVVWHDLVTSCIKANFGGIENLSLIPGTVGAAPIQNIGAYGVEIKDTLEALEAIDMYSGEKVYFRNAECKFGYRDSIFKNEYKERFFITSVVLRLTKHPVVNTNYGKIKEILDEENHTQIGIKEVSDAIIKIRQSKLPDPEKFGNAGSFFKNPIIAVSDFERIKGKHTNIPSYDAHTGYKKIPAAWLIDNCELKGKSRNGAAVHTDQPLVLINKNKAKGKDLIDLAQYVQDTVKQKFEIELEPEVRII